MSAGTERIRGNLLGDLRAEIDAAQGLLDRAFYPTPDCRSLIESADKIVVIGRRGTGKSALTHYLNKHWHGVDRTRVVSLAFDEAQVIGLCPILKHFGDNYAHVSAACKIAWRYALLMEVCLILAHYFKFQKGDADGTIAQHLEAWRANGNEVTERLRKTLDSKIRGSHAPETKIAELANSLALRGVENSVQNVFEVCNFECIVLVDRLDEGYQPDNAGTALVSGIVEAAIDIKTKYPKVRPILFLRDNMFRTMAHMNPNYSRNVEGHVLRLHWDEYNLQNMIANRLRIAFGLTEESTLKVWNRCTADDLKGADGFKRCLRMTLYRPRDILGLLNDAFYNAARQSRTQIVMKDIDAAAKIISHGRLDDLHKEYSTIFPGLSRVTQAFAHLKPEMQASDAASLIERECIASKNPDVVQEFTLLREPHDVLRALYGVGFIGVKDKQSGLYVFCHDGNRLDREIAPSDMVLVHPCFWMALNLNDGALPASDAEEIHDEYAITVTDEPIEIRNKKLGQIIAEYGNISRRSEDIKQYLDWCVKAIEVIFAGALHNIKVDDLSAEQSVGIVRTLNLGRTETWSALKSGYQVRQPLFGVTNDESLSRALIGELLGRATAQNGKLLFVITRGDSTEITKDGDLGVIREVHAEKSITVVRLTGKFLVGLLGKLRNPQKHDAIDAAFFGLLKAYSSMYIGDKKLIAPAPMAPVAAPLCTVDFPSNECYGEVDYNPDGEGPCIRLFLHKPGAGRKREVCDPIPISDQALRLLENGIQTARDRYVNQKREECRGKGTPVDVSECEPPDEYPFEVGWDQNELAQVFHKTNFDDLKKNEKGVIKTAMSRLRNLVRFSNQYAFISDADKGRREVTVRLRIKR